MKQLSLTVSLVLLPLLCGAQILNASGRTLEELLPDPACEHYWSEGDLNKDGISDLVVNGELPLGSTIHITLKDNELAFN